MEEFHRNHKEPAWGWLGVLMASRRVKTLRPKSRAALGVVTPWDRHAPLGWSA